MSEKYVKVSNIEKWIEVTTDCSKPVICSGVDLLNAIAKKEIPTYETMTREKLKENKLTKLVNYGFARAVGHTWTELNGVKNNPKAILIVANEAQKKHIELPKEQMISIAELPQKIMGRECPIIIDHFALKVLLNDLIDDISSKFLLPRVSFGRSREMSREIKFRQFVNGKWHYWGFIEEGVFVGPASETNKGGIIESQQFTGLHDKNGKEIYEGDLIKFFFSIIHDGTLTEMIDEVYFDDGCFLIRNIDDPIYKDCPLSTWSFNCEVIGNIFANPYYQPLFSKGEPWEE